jgi:ribose/xylose/arabinose/galactoside ABC-type transport system permease subunit
LAAAQPDQCQATNLCVGRQKDAAQRLGFQVFRLNCLVYGYLGQRPACHASSAAFSAPFSASRCSQLFRIPSSPATEFRVPGWQAIALLAGFAVGAIVGLINGFVIAYLGVSPILTTLGTMTMRKGLSIGLTHGNVLSGFPDRIVFLGNGTLMGAPVALFIFSRYARRWRCCSTRAGSATKST